MNPIRRRRLHRLAAEGLERRHATSHCAVETLAHHYIQAGDYERGLEYAKRAAAEAERVFAFDEAIAAYGRARDCAEALGLIDEQVAQEEAIGKSYLLHGEMIPAGEHFESALALASEPAVRARLQCQAAASLVATGNPRGLEHLRDALTVLDPVLNPLETANALSIEGRFHHLAGRHLQAIELLERAAELVAPAAAEKSVSTFAAPMISQVYAFLAGGYQHSGRFDDADRWARRTIEFGVAHNILFAQAIGNEFLGEDAVSKGEYENGLKYAARELEIVTRMQSRERRAWALMVRGSCFLNAGDLKHAEETLTEAIALAESIGEVRVAVLIRGNLAVTQARQGQLDQGLQTATENFEKAEASGLLYLRFEGLRCLAEVRRARAELDQAEALCAQASDLVSRTESRVSQLWLGPVYMNVLIESAAAFAAGGNRTEAEAKRARAQELLAPYQKLVSQCQSPGFSREAERLATLLSATN